MDCTSLTSVTIPDSVISINSSAFSNTAYYNNEANWENGVLYIGNHLIKAKSYTVSGEYQIKQGTKTIASGAFRDCTALTGVTIPESVTSIDRYTFHYCTYLTNVTIPDGVTEIGDSAFYGCTSLTSITIPDSVTSIGLCAFADCTSLTSITIPDGVTSIGEGTFSSTSLEIITIPDSVTSIGPSAFADCTALTSVIIPDSVTSIYEHAFCDCTSLTSMTIPDSVTSIGKKAFGYSYNVEEREYEKIPDFTISGYKGTEAERYANENGFTFIELQDEDPVIPCDVNGDGKVSAVDARWALQSAAKKRTLDEKQTKAADMNGDGKITAVDARQLLKKAAGSIAVSPGDAASNASLTVKADVDSAKAGDIITVSVDLNANSDLGSLMFALTYNPDEFEYIAGSAKYNSVFSAEVINGEIAGEILYAGVTDQSINKAGTLLTAQFKVLKTNSSFDIKVYEAYNGEDDDVTASVAENSAGTTVLCAHGNYTYEVIKDATCTEAGERKTICTYCGESFFEPIPAKGHSFGDWVVTTEATCTEEGVETRTCANCGEAETRPVSAKGHSLTLHQGFAATCEADGEKDYYICSVCGKCFEDEAATEEITNLDEWKIIPAKGHSFGAWAETKAATCTEAGIETRTCTVCGKTETQPIPAKGHNWVVSEDGSKQTCTVCGAEETLVTPGDVNGDGKVSAVDARWALQCAAKKRELNEQQTKAADMNKDGKITAVDARQILKKAAGKA